MVILISHRLANVINADHIFVIEKGEIVETGNHERLLAKCGIYSRLYGSQQELEKYSKLDTNHVLESYEIRSSLNGQTVENVGKELSHAVE